MAGHRWPIKGTKMRSLLVAIVLVTVVAAVTLAATISSRHLRPITAYQDNLRLVHVVFRHGVRTPADTYPNDIYINETFYPYGWGQLTNKGKLNQFESGKYLRERYDDFLGKIYSPSLLYAQSSASDRAIMSCALTLAGLWPTKGTDMEWSPELNWSPIPIKSQPLDEDTLLIVRKSCPRYNEELNNVMNSSKIQEILKENQKLFNNLTTITGLSIKTPHDIESLYNTLLAEEQYGLKLPQWTEDYFPDKLLPLTEFKFIIDTYNDELKRLKGGLLLKKIIQDWTAKENNTLSPDGRKIFVYAGHDHTIANLLSAFGVWELQNPVYGIMILLELYEDETSHEYGVEIYLRNSTKVEPYLLTLKGCTPRCPIHKVIDLTKNVIPQNWEEECKAKNPDFKPPAPTGP